MILCFVAVLTCWSLFFRATSLDVEPVYTFRAHIGPVLCLAVNSTGEQCFSGGHDSTIRCWNIPSSNIDPYDSFGTYDIFIIPSWNPIIESCYLIDLHLFVNVLAATWMSFLINLHVFSIADQNVLNCTLEGHTNAVWGLSVHSSKMQLLSCSADGTVRLWSPGEKPPLLQSYTAEEGKHPRAVRSQTCSIHVLLRGMVRFLFSTCPAVLRNINQIKYDIYYKIGNFCETV